MRVIGLIHTITQDMPVYPGPDTPQLAPAGTYENDGFAPQEALLFLRHREYRESQESGLLRRRPLLV